MQRIKSQSISQTNIQSTINTSQRPRSKKNNKEQSNEHIGYTVDRSKHSVPTISQNSLVSIKATSRPVSGSMKNLRVANTQQNLNKYCQNTSKMIVNQSSNISARILKQIVGYSNRGASNSKPKNFNKDHTQDDNRDDHTIRIDLAQGEPNHYDVDRDNQCQWDDGEKEEHQPRTTLSNNKDSRSQDHSSRKKQSYESSQKKKKKKKQGNDDHRVVQEFSPMNLSPNCKEKDKSGMEFSKKCAFFNSNTEEIIKISARKINPKSIQPNQILDVNATTKIGLVNNSLHHPLDLSKANYDTFNNNYSSFNDIQRQPEITNPCVRIMSPHNLLTSLDKSGLSRISEVPFAFHKENYKILGNSMLSQRNQKDDRKTLEIALVTNLSEPQLQEEKEKLIISLENSSTILQQLYDYKFKELVPCWNSLISEETTLNNLVNQSQHLENELKKYEEEDLVKKTALYELNRESICRKKQKDYITRNNKDRYIQEAVSCQEGLKLKLSSKADYQHVILFNERVILTGRNPTEDLYQLFVEMFQTKLSKKFALIAKKQLANLSVYDSRLVHDFLKRIQEIQLLYCKSEIQQHSQANLNQNYNSTDEQLRIEQLVQQIQQITLQSQKLKTKLHQKSNTITQTEQRIKSINQQIVNYIKSMNKKISSEYKISEGQQYNFEELLRNKCENEFEAYRKELKHRDQILTKLNAIQRIIARNGKNMRKSPQNSGRKEKVVSLACSPERNVDGKNQDLDWLNAV